MECPNCKGQLEWVDTMDFEGGIDEGYIRELQVHECTLCKQEFIVTKFVNFDKKNISIEKIEKS